MAFQKPQPSNEKIEEVKQEVPSSVNTAPANPLLSEQVVDNPNVTKSFDNNVNYSTFNIPEQQFVPKTQQQQAQESERMEQKPFNPEVNDLSNKEKKIASENMAKMIISGYAFMHKFPNKWVQISDFKIKKLQQSGLDLFSVARTEGGRNVTVADEIREYNGSVSNAFNVSAEFVEKVEPVLCRVLEKKGLAMTDEQLLMYYVAEDLVLKTTQFMELKKVSNEILASLSKMANNKTQSTPQPVQQQSYSTSNQEQESVKEPTVVVVEPQQNTNTVEEPKKRGRKAGTKNKDYSKIEEAEVL